MKILRGEVFLANLDPTVGREIKKTRPVVIVSNNLGNEHGGTVTVVPVTSKNLEKVYPFEVFLSQQSSGLSKSSKGKADQVRTIDRSRLLKKLGKLDGEAIAKLNQALKVHLNL